MTQAMKWTPDVVVQTIQELHRRKQPLHSNWMQRTNAPLYVAAGLRFGGWKQAIAAAGLDYEKIRAQPPQRKWSKEAVKKEILRRKEAGLTLSASGVLKEHSTLIYAATKYFGRRGWNKALTYAGLDYREYDTRIKWTIKSVIAVIQKRHNDGQSLNLGALETPELCSLRAGAEKVFGTWAAAIDAAGLDYESIRLHVGKCWWSEEKVLEHIRALERNGVRLNSSAMQQSQVGLFQAARYRFGSWPNAVVVAGINYREHIKIWSLSRWMEQIDDVAYHSVLERACEMSDKRRKK